MATGTVKWFNKDKGFGFILPDEGGGRDIYVHASNIDTPERVLSDGQRVQYETAMGKKGPEAVKVKPV